MLATSCVYILTFSCFFLHHWVMNFNELSHPMSLNWSNPCYISRIWWCKRFDNMNVDIVVLAYDIHDSTNVSCHWWNKWVVGKHLNFAKILPSTLIFECYFIYCCTKTSSKSENPSKVSWTSTFKVILRFSHTQNSKSHIWG